MKLILFALLLLTSQILQAQYSYKDNHWDIRKTIRDATITDKVCYNLIGIDTTLGDSCIYSRCSDTYTAYTKEGQLLAKGKMTGGISSKCGCELSNDGYWTTYYRNGQPQSQGNYDCETKIGTWVSYHDNGRIAEIVHYKRPYNEMIRRSTDKHTLPQQPLLSDLYLAYYPNGQIRTAGNYKIVEQFSDTDTIYTYNPATFEPDSVTILQGEFWKPISKKVDTWTEYAPDGSIMSQTDYPTDPWQAQKIRGIYKRERQIIYELSNPLPAKK